MKFLKSIMLAVVLFVSLAHSPAQASSREATNFLIGAGAALLFVGVVADLVEYNNDPYWSHRDRSGCYYRRITTTDNEYISCRQNRGYYYHGGHHYQCVTVQNTHTEYVRSCR